MSLSRDDFFSVIEAVEVAPVELSPGKIVHVRTVDYDVIQACRTRARKTVKQAGVEQDNAFAREIIAACVCDEQGNLLLTHDDADRLNKTQMKMFKKLAAGALKVNGLTDDAAEDEKKD